VNKPYHIVFTTINHPAILEDVYDNLHRFGQLDRVTVWIVGDRKTPASAEEIAREVSRKGLETSYFDIVQQDKWGKLFPFYKMIPYNTDGRRVFGYLKALEHGCRTLISIDDDNFPTNDNFISHHGKTGQSWTGSLIREPSQFHNICEYLTLEPQRLVFPRGFPFQLRGHSNQPQLLPAPNDTIIGVTEGLWLDEPDVDATTWLNGKVKGVRYGGPDHFVLEQSTWSPVNTQNTSVMRELIPAFVFVTMAWPVPGGKLDRYGDIWGGYFLLALMQGTNYHVAFGRPLVEHRRNPHNYIDDLRYEFWGMILTDWLLKLLRTSFKPSCKCMTERVLELAEFLQADAVSQLPAWCPVEVREFLVSTAANLRQWSAACQQIGV
jgi:Reversibly glycosylated polypeptide